ALGGGGLSLADLLRLRAQASTPARAKSVIMIILPGGPSHIDMYDMKPNAPAEFRGEFRPIKTNVAGIDISEILPKQAALMDKMAIVRGIKFDTGPQMPHFLRELITGFNPFQPHRPALGSVVSKLRGIAGGMPPYVSLSERAGEEDPSYLG